MRVWPVRGMTLEWARAEFDRMLRPIVLQALGWQALHAGAALTSEGALLFCGRSGAGKSTTAYALGKMGWTQLADNQVVWRLHDGRRRFKPCPSRPGCAHSPRHGSPTGRARARRGRRRKD